MTAERVIALAGNPNSGKTTLFNRLTGLRQRVGNYPGVTVEKKSGTIALADGAASVVDLPGAYSLVARSREEAIAHEVLSSKPAAVVVVLDASNLERNLYLALQVLELGRPTVVALNMTDVAEELGLRVDAEALSRALGVPVVPIVASRGTGTDALIAAISRTITGPPSPVPRRWALPPDGEAELARIADETGTALSEASWLVGTVAAARDAGTLGADGDPLPGREDTAKKVQAHLQNGASALPAAIIEARYAAISRIAGDATTRIRPAAPTLTDRIDAVLLHRVLGPLALLVVLGVVFQSLFTWAEPLMDAVEGAFGALGGWAGDRMPEGPLRGLLVDGVIAGVGSVLVFIPQIAFLFLLLGLLEDSGYLARAAYIMDRLMAKVGLHGRAFVPLLSGFACAIPAIMATRTIESPKDRLVTILVTPLASCSARLPVYTLVLSALFGGSTTWGLSTSALLMLSMYVLSIVSAIGIAGIFKRTLLKSPTPPLVLELPPYKAPQLGGVLRRVGERCWVFTKDAGTVILACSIVLWALLSYPKELPASYAPSAIAAMSDAELRAAKLEHSYAGRLGHLIEPVIEPLGFDWRIGVGIVASFAAREVIVATLGLVFGLGDSDEESEGLRAAIGREYTPLVGLSLMVFFLFAMQCMSTLAIVRRETRSWRWPVFLFTYMSCLAWAASFVVYQVGLWIS